MPLLSRRSDKPLIPPVDENPNAGPPPTSSGGFRRSNAATYVPSRDGANPHPTSSSQSTSEVDDTRDRYSRTNGVGDIYSRGGAHLDQDRNELFSGYNPEKAGSGRFLDGPDVDRQGDEDEDVEGIKQQTRYIKQESVTSTRNAIRMARDAEEVASNSLLRIGEQSGTFIQYVPTLTTRRLILLSTEKLASTERHLDVSKSHAQKASDQTDDLKKLNRSIFRPVITFNKDAKRRAKDVEIQRRYDEERDEREKAMLQVRETQERIGRAQTYGRRGEELDGGDELLGSREAPAKSPKQSQRSRYQFEASGSDDEMEDELDRNLDEIDDVTKRLKALGTAMGQEIHTQNGRLDTIGTKTDGLDMKLATVTRRVRFFSSRFIQISSFEASLAKEILVKALDCARMFCPL